MSQDDKLQSSTDRHVFRRGAETPGRHKASDEDFRFAYQNERTVEMRRRELQNLFGLVDVEQQPKEEQTQVRVLGEVANIHKAQENRGTVMRTEIVPMLPCKGYGLPRRNLFIGGRGEIVQVPHSVEEYQQVEALLDKAQLVEEQLAKQKLKEELEKEQKRDRVFRLQKTKRPSKYGKETEVGVLEPGEKLPNCTVG